MATGVGVVQLPGPFTKIVVFRDKVFRLRYILSNCSVSDVNLNADALQADLTRMTEGILEQWLSYRRLPPLKTDYMLVYPGLLDWGLVMANKLLFYQHERNLQPHPHTIQLFVHIVAAPYHTKASNKIARKRPHPEDVSLPVCTGIVRSEYLVRKKLRMTPSVACLPCTGHAQTGPSPDTVGKVARNVRSEFKKLSKPSSSHTNERLEVVKNEESFLRGIVRSVKTLFSWT
ncbi:uncharacterized protein LOC135348670 [Halichondria panicea]|uniref:uncharacterized protein LOC135348670 n=1 Tax=Halichondria panicea TaxID=6063 RepID=UPI00312B7F81